MTVEPLTPDERRERFADPRSSAIVLPMRRCNEAAVERLAMEAGALGVGVEWT